LTASVIVAGLGLGAALGGVHVARLHPPVVADVVAQSAVVLVDAQVTGDPVAHWPTEDSGWSAEPTWTLAARVTHLTARGVSHAVAIPVVLRGDAIRSIAYGTHVRLTGRAQQAWAPESASMAITVLGDVQIRSPPGRVASVTTRIRTAFRGAVAGLPQDAGALLLGLAVGDESLVDPDLDRAMIRAGLAHLTAVSGSNTALVVGIAMAGVVALGWGWRARVLVSVLVLAGYVALVRPQPSVLRAAGMGIVALLALTTGGQRRGPPALLAAVIVLLVGWPQFALSIGFALSVAATAGLLLIGPGVAQRLARWPLARRAPEPIRAALAVAAAAHMATLPLAVLLGNGASLVALPANVIVTPLVPVATVLGLAAALVAPFAGSIASVLAHVAAPATAGIAWVAHTSADLPLGVLPVPGGARPALATALGLAAALLVARLGWRPWRDRRVLLAAAVLAGVGLAWRLEADRRWPPPDWAVLACDVGQGDGLLLRRPGAGHVLVVDVGPAGGGIVGCLEDAQVTPAAVLLTHFHADHVDGLSEVLARWRVPVILTTPNLEPADGVALVAAGARSAGVPVRSVRAGDRLEVAGVPLRVLWPARRIAESPENNASVVLVADIPTEPGDLGVLLTGDIEPEAQSAVMAGRSPDVDVVKVPHHGSRHQAPGFARWAGAGIALVSAGAGNDYGHPSPLTLAQYRDSGARIGRTDEQGALAVVVVVGRAGPALVVQR
jgi:competence protein ComEC